MLIEIPATWVPERSYVIHVIWSVFLGLRYELRIRPASDTVVVLPGGGRLVIRDSFFGQWQEPDGYLRSASLPRQVNFFSHDLVPASNIPVIFGQPSINIEQRQIVCGIDIIASVFFMLCRWEEKVSVTRDEHGRFPSQESVAARSGFLDRPVVNEYVEFIWTMLHHLGNRQPRTIRSPRIRVTHDVDHLRFPFMPKRIAYELFLHPKPRHAVYLLNAALHNTYDCFGDLMDHSERFGCRSVFYFMDSGSTRFDHRYTLSDRLVLKRIHEILRRGHSIGLHASYGSYQDPELLEREKDALERAAGINVEDIRFHYLRFRVPDTFRLCENAGLLRDSTCGFPDRVGYRCGTGDAFPVFDCTSRKQLNLVEEPLVCMDKALLAEGRTTSGIRTLVEKLIAHARSYRSMYTVLVHNNFRHVWRERGLDFNEFYDALVGLRAPGRSGSHHRDSEASATPPPT